MKNTLRFLAALALGAASITPSLHAAESRPNIIFLLAHDLAANAVGYSGNKDVITPNIDQLSRDGVRFMSHYDTELTAIAPKLAHEHGYENYPKLFNRTIAWDAKAPLVNGLKSSAEEGEAPAANKSNRKKDGND